MKTSTLLKCTAVALAGGLAIALATPLPALAEDSIYVPLFTYRTGPFSNSGTPIADGMHDYLTMLNERDGGIGGVKIASTNARPATTPRRVSSATIRSSRRTR